MLNPAFDRERAIELAEKYTLSTSVGVTLVDENSERISTLSSSPCSICDIIRKEKDQSFNCFGVHRYGASQAERFGGKYIYFCPMGFVFFSALIRSGGVKGFFIGGPVLLTEKDDFVQNDLVIKNSLSHSTTKKIEKCLEEIDTIAPKRVSALSELLYVAALSLSVDESEKQNLLENDKIQDTMLNAFALQSELINQQKPYPIEKERELLSSISAKDKKSAQRLLNEILGSIFFAEQANVDIIRARALELLILLSRAVITGGADVQIIFGLNYQYINEVTSLKTIDDISFWLSKIIVRFMDCMFDLIQVKHVDIIFKSIEFINQNYFERLTLESVAQRVYLSPTYFSKIFKEEVGMSFNDYLSHLRVKKSEALLLNPDYSLVDIAQTVGFSDQSYYTKVFKKFMDKTPAKYRAMRG